MKDRLGTRPDGPGTPIARSDEVIDKQQRNVAIGTKRTSTLLRLMLLQRYRHPAQTEGSLKPNLLSLQLQNNAVRVL
jgi:hypothetical protein